MTLKLKQLVERYMALAHAVQSGIAQLMVYDDKFTTPKHLRVGIDMTKADIGGLTQLLIRKGVFTEEEYYAAMVEGAEREVSRYEGMLRDKMGFGITLL